MIENPENLNLENLIVLQVRKIPVAGDYPRSFMNCYIEALVGGSEAPGTPIMMSNEFTRDAIDPSGQTLYKAQLHGYLYLGDQPVIIRINGRNGHLAYNRADIITQNGLNHFVDEDFFTYDGRVPNPDSVMPTNNRQLHDDIIGINRERGFSMSYTVSNGEVNRNGDLIEADTSISFPGVLNLNVSDDDLDENRENCENREVESGDDSVTDSTFENIDL